MVPFYENDNSPIKKLDEPPALGRVPSHFVRVRLLCAVAEGASDLPGRLPKQQQYDLGRGCAFGFDHWHRQHRPRLQRASLRHDWHL